MNNQQKLQNIIKEKPYLAWDTRQFDKLSTESIVEKILNYGHWEEYMKVEEIIGLKEVSRIFDKMKNRKRVNLRPQVVNYFSKYFKKYA
ncbi:hypothetical protein JW796_01590 [Candidatus Dojkabacteria bacterium]|nr:hypothetical protein [Candidatus Dojkabacteria bacterium]